MYPALKLFLATAILAAASARADVVTQSQQVLGFKPELTLAANVTLTYDNHKSGGTFSSDILTPLDWTITIDGQTWNTGNSTATSVLSNITINAIGAGPVLSWNQLANFLDFYYFPTGRAPSVATIPWQLDHACLQASQCPSGNVPSPAPIGMLAIGAACLVASRRRFPSFIPG